MALLYKNKVQVESQRQPLLVPLCSKAPAFCLPFKQAKCTQVFRITKLIMPGLFENQNLALLGKYMEKPNLLKRYLQF